MYQESVTGSFVFSLTQGAVCIPPDTSDAGWRYPSALWAPMLSAALHAVLRTQRCAAGAMAILLQVRTEDVGPPGLQVAGRVEWTLLCQEVGTLKASPAINSVLIAYVQGALSV